MGNLLKTARKKQTSSEIKKNCSEMKKKRKFTENTIIPIKISQKPGKIANFP